MTQTPPRRPSMATDAIPSQRSFGAALVLVVRHVFDAACHPIVTSGSYRSVRGRTASPRRVHCSLVMTAARCPRSLCRCSADSGSRARSDTIRWQKCGPDAIRRHPATSMAAVSHAVACIGDVVGSTGHCPAHFRAVPAHRAATLSRRPGRASTGLVSYSPTGQAEIFPTCRRTRWPCHSRSALAPGGKHLAYPGLRPVDTGWRPPRWSALPEGRNRPPSCEPRRDHDD